MIAQEIIRAELDADLLSRGYAAMSDYSVWFNLCTENRIVWVSVSASDVLEAITESGWNGLEASGRADVDSILSMGDGIDLSPGSNARTLLEAAFAGSAATLAAVEATAKRTVSRATELGCAVTPYIVTAARGLE